MDLKGLGECLTIMFILAPFGIWKIAEIIIWLSQHIRINII